MGLSTFIFFWIAVLVTLTSITFDDLIIQIFSIVMKHISIYSDNIYIMIMAADISRFYLIIIFQHRPLNSPPPPQLLH